MTATTKVEPTDCTSAEIDGCTRCGRIMHRGGGPTCTERHPRHKGGGLCSPCYNTTWKAGRRGLTARDQLMRAWADLAEIGVGFREFPRHVGKTYTAWERAYQRARKAGHPLARRFDLET